MSEPLLAVSARDMAGRFGFHTDEAMQRPIGITRDGTTRVVMLSLTEYERLKRRDRQVIRTEDLNDETLEAFRSVKAPRNPSPSTTLWTIPKASNVLS